MHGKPHSQGNEETGIYSKQKNMIKKKHADLNEMELGDLFDRKLKIMLIKVLTKIRRAMYEQSEDFNKAIENI